MRVGWLQSVELPVAPKVGSKFAKHDRATRNSARSLEIDHQRSASDHLSRCSSWLSSQLSSRVDCGKREGLDRRSAPKSWQERRAV